MRLPLPNPNSRRSGYALVIALCFLSVSLVAYTSLVFWVSSNAQITTRNNSFTQCQAAAESATESVLANMMRDFNSQGLGSASTYTASANLPSQTGWPKTFAFSDTNGIANATTVSIGLQGWTNLPAPYQGLFGIGEPTIVASQAAPANTSNVLSATVSQNIWFGSIPIFQFAIFYNLDLEINPGAAMNIKGRVHSNNNIYATGNSSSQPLTFTTNVEASATNVYTTASPLDPQNGPTGANRSGNVVFNATPQNGAPSLTMPIGTNNSSASVIGILGIPPAGTDPTTTAGQQYEYNQADIIVSNSAAGNLSVYYFNQNLSPSPTFQLIPMDVTNYIVSGGVTNVGSTYYSFATNVSFFDYRQNTPVQAVQIDVHNFATWLTNTVNGGTNYTVKNTTGTTSKGHGVNGIYVYNSAPNSISQLPAVRVVNGAQLPTNGLSVVTPFPLYVKGNYNTTTNGINYSTTLGDTTNTRPAALMGDAITVLSGAWNDPPSSTGLSSRATPTATTINAACLEGIDISDGNNYSGGVENFMRLLESWSGVTLTYNGSIVVLFQSQYATAPWKPTNNYYNAPNRQWGFDTRFNTQSLLPPMTPQVRAIIREGWTTW